MLEFYFEGRIKLQQLRQCPIGDTLDDFAQWLKSSGYKHRPGQLTLRATAHFGYWLSMHDRSIANLNDVDIGVFTDHVPDCHCSHPFQGQDRYHAEGARAFLRYLRTIGIAQPAV